MSKRKVVVYPSGFIGYDVGWPVVKEEEKSQTNQIVNILGTNKYNLSISNRSIERIFHEYNTRTRKLTDATFLGDILSACCNAFGTVSFYEWLHIQEQNPYFSSYHRQFINETLHVIFESRRRPTLLQTWAGLLKPVEITSADKNVIVEDEKFLKKYTEESMLVLNVIKKWTQAPGGWEDMLYSMHLIFGDIN